jgi:hypothetical protein
MTNTLLFVEHHTKNESNKFHKRIREVTQEFKPRINACRNADGKILTENEDVQRRWKEYFESVLTGNSDDTDNATFLQPKMKIYNQAMKKWHM